ncbi:MAG: ribonuclease III [Patescibacteria group bacterium]
MADAETLGKTIGINFRRVELLKEALTHRSYLNENPSWPLPDNERLEYLGDAVLELAVTEFLFKTFPEKQEGELTSFRAALVNYQMLAAVARSIKLDDFLLLSKGEAKDTGKAREVILANAFEAIVGAVYLDQGYDAARGAVERTVLPCLDEVIAKGLNRDPKSMLQERSQERFKVTPTYRVLKEEGPDHKKQFLVGVYLGDELAGKGYGTSKQEAEARAADAALKMFE